MNRKYFSMAMIFVCAFLIVATQAKIGFCDAADDLIEQGKDLLIKHSDVYGADAKFAEALGMNPIYPTNDKANFWRAITVISSNLELTTTLKNLGIISNDIPPAPLLFDKQHKPLYDISAITPVIIDNTDAGYSDIGTGWTSAPAHDTIYGSDARIHIASSDPNSTNKAVWTFTVPMAGEYEVVIWYPYLEGLTAAPDAKYTVYYDGGHQTITWDQGRQHGQWQMLGKYKFSSGYSATVELSDYASPGSYVIADAVKFVYKGIYMSDDGPEAVFNPTGDWHIMPAGYVRGGSYKEIDKGSGGTCVWTPDILTPGKYMISAIWIYNPDGATDAVFTITPNGSTPVNISVNQKEGEEGYFTCKDLGTFTLEAGTGNTIKLSQNTGGKVTTDGIILLPVRDYPNLTEGQTTLSSMLTQVDEALEYLDDVGGSTFQDHADLGAVDDLGSPMLTEIDYGDVLMLKAGLNMLKSQLNILAAYNLNSVDIQKLGTAYQALFSINDFLNQYTELGTLMSGAAARLATAKEALIDSIRAYRDGYDFIMAETDDQRDDLITFGKGSSEMMDSFINPRLDEVLNNLNGPSPYFTILSTDFANDSNSPYYKIAVNLRAFFDTPVDFKANLPHFDANNKPLRSSWPDPTFGGVLPGMTKAELNGMAGLGSWLSQPLILWTGDIPSVKLEWKADTYNDFLSYKIYRSTSDDVGENANGSLRPGTTLLATITDTTFTDTTINSSQRIYYYRLYTYYLGGDETASVIKRVVTKVYVYGASASGAEDGSPGSPYKHLSDGIANATDGAKICVAKGTYNESARTLPIWNKDGLVLEGGYASSNWTRNIAANETIIDATGYNDYAAVGISNVSGIIIDGFTITNAIGQDWATGIDIWNASSTSIKNCKVTNCNRGIQVDEGSPSCVIKNCVIEGRKGEDTGHEGISVYHAASLKIKNCSITNNKGQGIIVGDNSSVSVTGCYIAQDGSDGICLTGTGNSLEAVNNLIVNNDGRGIICNSSGGTASLVNNTIANNKGSDGIYYANLVSVEIKNNIITNNNGGGGGSGIRQDGSCSTRTITNNDSYGHISANYNNCGTDAGSNGNISADPLFVISPLGSYYLSQTAADPSQTSDSPCVNTGSDTAANLGLSDMTTRTDNIADSGIVDMGYHYLNHPPLLNPIGNKNVNEGTLLQFTVSSSDPDGNTLTYSTSTLPPNATFDPIARTFSWTPAYNQAGTYAVTFTVSDGVLTDSETITITVNNVKDVTYYPSSGRLESETLANPDGEGNIYYHYIDENFNGQGYGRVDKTLRPAPGKDGALAYEYQYFGMGPNIVISEDTTWSSGTYSFNSVTISAGKTLTVTGTACLYSNTGILGSGNLKVETGNFCVPSIVVDTLTIGAGSTVTIAPLPGGPGAGMYFTNNKVYRKRGYQDANFTILLFYYEYDINGNVVKTNHPPVLSPIGDKGVNENESLPPFLVYATDSDNDTLTYSATGLPVGAAFDTSTKIFSWTPTDSQVGTHTVTFTVSDGILTDSETITITVNHVNGAPMLSAISDKTVKEGAQLQFSVSATDPDGDALTYSANNLPQGARFDAKTRMFTYTPTHQQVGKYKVIFAVSDGKATTNEGVTITVNNVNRAPVLSAISDKTVTEGTLLQFSVSATDPDGDALTYSANNLPQGADFNPRTRIFTWAPTYQQAGAYKVGFTVSDGKLTDGKTIIITVINVNLAPTCRILVAPDPTNSYKFIFAADAKDLDGKVIKYYWDMGDGTTRNETKFAYTYKKAGIYLVRLIVEDNEGMKSRMAIAAVKATVKANLMPALRR